MAKFERESWAPLAGGAVTLSVELASAGSGCGRKCEIGSSSGCAKDGHGRAGKFAKMASFERKSWDNLANLESRGAVVAKLLAGSPSPRPSSSGRGSMRAETSASRRCPSCSGDLRKVGATKTERAEGNSASRLAD
jgi:hypothetical protein